MARTFSLEIQSKLNRSGAVLDVPHTAILRFQSPQDLIDEFEARWGTRPDAVTLPVSNPDGLLLPVKGLARQMSQAAYNFAGGANDFSELVKQFADLGVDIYLLLDPTLPFLNSDPLQVLDIVGDSSRQLCVGNPQTQAIAGAVLGTAVDDVLETLKKSRSSAVLRGLVLDLVDLWPLGGNGNRLELTCFCPACMDWFEAHSTRPKLVEEFKTFPNPWSLALRVSDTSGIEHISDIGPDTTPEEIVGLSKLKGFVSAFEGVGDGALNEKGAALIDYIKVRHKQTLSAAQEIFAEALQGLDEVEDEFVKSASENIKRILLMEGVPYSWTNGLKLENLDRKVADAYDEVWYDIRSSTQAFENMPYRSYMSTRSRYYIDAFYQLATNAADASARASTGIGRLSEQDLKAQLQERLSKSMACLMEGETALGALPPIKDSQGGHEQRAAGSRIGFVGVGMNKEAGEAYIKALDVAPGLARSDGHGSEAEKMRALLEIMARQRG